MENKSNTPEHAAQPRAKGQVAQAVSLAFAPLGLGIIADGATNANLKTIALGAGIAIAGLVVAFGVHLFSHTAN